MYLQGLLFLIVFSGLILTNSSNLFLFLASGLGASVFLLLIHLATLGKGMGLGDVKLVIPAGIAFGYPLAVVWMFSSFILGSIVGIILILLHMAKLKQKIAFGPFLVLGFFVVAFFGLDILIMLSLV